MQCFHRFEEGMFLPWPISFSRDRTKIRRKFGHLPVRPNLSRVVPLPAYQASSPISARLREVLSFCSNCLSYFILIVHELSFVGLDEC